MAYHITRPNALDPSKVVYYTGGNTWSDDPADKKSFATKAKAEELFPNPDGTNGGFKNATAVKS